MVEHHAFLDVVDKIFKSALVGEIRGCLPEIHQPVQIVGDWDHTSRDGVVNVCEAPARHAASRTPKARADEANKEGTQTGTGADTRTGSIPVVRKDVDTG